MPVRGAATGTLPRYPTGQQVNRSVAIQPIRKQYQERAHAYHHRHHHHKRSPPSFSNRTLPSIGGLSEVLQGKDSTRSPIPSLSSNHYYNAEHYRHRLTSPEEAGLGADIVAAAAFGCFRWAAGNVTKPKNESNSWAACGDGKGVFEKIER